MRFHIASASPGVIRSQPTGSPKGRLGRSGLSARPDQRGSPDLFRVHSRRPVFPSPFVNGVKKIRRRSPRDDRHGAGSAQRDHPGSRRRRKYPLGSIDSNARPIDLLPREDDYLRPGPLLRPPTSIKLRKMLSSGSSTSQRTCGNMSRDVNQEETSYNDTRRRRCSRALAQHALL